MDLTNIDELSALVEGGFLTVNVARARAGLPPVSSFEAHGCAIDWHAHSDADDAPAEPQAWEDWWA